MSDYKQVIIVDESQPTGILANSIAALSVSMGKAHPEVVGYELEDTTGHKRNGITQIAIPILKGGESLGELRESLKASEHELTIIDIIDATTSTRSYDEYADVLKKTPLNNLKYYGLLIYGKKKVVNKYTGSLGLLR